MFSMSSWKSESVGATGSPFASAAVGNSDGSASSAAFSPWSPPDSPSPPRSPPGPAELLPPSPSPELPATLSKASIFLATKAMRPSLRRSPRRAPPTALPVRPSRRRRASFDSERKRSTLFTFMLGSYPRIFIRVPLTSVALVAAAADAATSFLGTAFFGIAAASAAAGTEARASACSRFSARASASSESPGAPRFSIAL
mmetsp:Transcript_59690/g.135069  ORF Transcript_59690/g.135069 Transcript_59690/m.135069 type:complete len:200 (-) Transcript_59690:628-1227(-)